MIKWIKSLFKKPIQKTTPTVEGFKEFVKTQSGDYNINDPFNCAIAQYVETCGHKLIPRVKLHNAWAYKLDDGGVFDIKAEDPNIIYTMLMCKTWEQLGEKL